MWDPKWAYSNKMPRPKRYLYVSTVGVFDLMVIHLRGDVRALKCEAQWSRAVCAQQSRVRVISFKECTYPYCILIAYPAVWRLPLQKISFTKEFSARLVGCY